MPNQDKMQLFENQPIRSVWDEEKEEWYFSVVDVVQVLTDSVDGRKYWNKLKQRLSEEGSELVTICHQLKLMSSDGKRYATDVADTEGIFRIIQSIPSKKAEPFKMWLAKVGKERIDETIDPELAINRAVETYRKKGYSEDWIHQRVLSIRVRKELTDEWRIRGVKKGKEYAILTDEISKAWSGMTTRQYKNHKGLKKENLRDNMSTSEIVLNMLAEVSTKEISEAEKPDDMDKHKDVARRGGKVAGDARRAIESQTGKKIITKKNATDFRDLMNNLIESDFGE
ncbi:Bro-N domain-containing protein [Candidatus Saccharibacteria bacterium]|nr:Bro-N domain-containing protein [Candidatus Saccharibacteria bacterium]